MEMENFISTRRFRGTFLLAPLLTFSWMSIWGTGSTKSSRARGHEVSPELQAPLWQLDVRALGYTLQRVDRERESPSDQGKRLCFPDEQQVIVAFVAPRPANALAEWGPAHRGEPSPALPFRLQALFVDTATGKVRDTRKWPTASKWAWITWAPGGKFVVVTPERLTLYSRAIQELSHLDLPISLDAIKDSWRLLPSASGKYMVLEYEPRSDKGNPLEWRGVHLRRQWIEAENLRVLREWTLEGVSAGSTMRVSDDGTALVDYKIGEPDGPFRRLCYPSQSQPYCGRLSLLANGTVLSLSFPGRVEWMSLIGTNGDLLFEQNFLPGEVYRWWATSADGHRLALALDRGKGGSAALDIAPHYSLSRVIVYDLSARRWIYALDGKKQGLKSISGLALSPSGSQLALINQDGILQVYRLPESSTTAQPTQ
jgi:hypothetical protein